MPPMTTSDDLHVLLNANPKGAREALIASYRRQLVKGRMAPVDNDGEMGGTPMRCSVFCVAGFAYVTLTQDPLCGPKYHWTDRSRICVCVCLLQEKWFNIYTVHVQHHAGERRSSLNKFEQCAPKKKERRASAWTALDPFPSQTAIVYHRASCFWGGLLWWWAFVLSIAQAVAAHTGPRGQ